MIAFSKKSWSFLKGIAFLMSPIFLGVLIFGCGDPMILMNDSERGIWRYHAGIPDKEASLLRVKNLSRDLQTCIQRRGYASLSEQQIQQISVQDNQEIHDQLTEALPLCQGILDNLFDKLRQAYETGNRHKKLYQAIVDGQADSSLP